MHTRPLVTNQKSSQDKAFQKTKLQTAKYTILITNYKLQLQEAVTSHKAPQTNNHKFCPSHFTHFSIDLNELSLYAQLLKIFGAFSDHGQMMETIGYKIIIMLTRKLLQFQKVFASLPAECLEYLEIILLWPRRNPNGLRSNQMAKNISWLSAKGPDSIQSVLIL